LTSCSKYLEKSEHEITSIGDTSSQSSIARSDIALNLNTFGKENSNLILESSIWPNFILKRVFQTYRSVLFISSKFFIENIQLRSDYFEQAESDDESKDKQNINNIFKARYGETNFRSMRKIIRDALTNIHNLAKVLLASENPHFYLVGTQSLTLECVLDNIIASLLEQSLEENIPRAMELLKYTGGEFIRLCNPKRYIVAQRIRRALLKRVESRRGINDPKIWYFNQVLMESVQRFTIPPVHISRSSRANERSPVLKKSMEKSGKTGSVTTEVLPSVTKYLRPEFEEDDVELIFQKEKNNPEEVLENSSIYSKNSSNLNPDYMMKSMVKKPDLSSVLNLLSESIPNNE